MKVAQKHIIYPCLVLTLTFFILMTPLTGAAQVQAKPTITIQDLGSLQGRSTEARDVNDKGQVVGSSIVLTAPNYGGAHAFIWTQEDGMKDLGIDSIYSVANAINEKGTVTGVYAKPDGTRGSFIWTEKYGVEYLDCSLPNYPNTAAFDINDKDQVFGISIDSAFKQVFFVWSHDDGIQQIQLPREFQGTNGIAINNKGIVVGSPNQIPYNPYGPYPFMWSAKDGITELSSVFGTNNGNARDINNKGIVVGGFSSTSSFWQSQSYYWSPEIGLHCLGSPEGMAGSQCLAVNEKGQIVGDCWTVSWPVGHQSYYYDDENGMILLSQLQDTVKSDPLSINNKGQIVGTCTVLTPQGQQVTHAVMWTIE